MKVSAVRITGYVGYMNRADLSNPLIKEEMITVAQALVEMHFTKGECILAQGDLGSPLLYGATARLV